MTRSLKLGAVALCILGLMGAGCDNSTPTDVSNTAETNNTVATEASTLNACKLLTKEIASAYLGNVNEPTLSDTAGVVSTCSYSESVNFKSLTLLVRRSQDNVESATVNSSAKAESKNISGVDAEDVPGLGDSAYWAGGALNQLNVFNGRDWLILSAMKKDFNKDKAIEIMQEVLKNY